MNLKATINNSVLGGIRVLDLSRFISGPYCAMILGDMGADVVKVEKPGVGDLGRTYQPQIGGQSAYSLIFNRNKRGLVIDFRSSEGRSTLKDLIRASDVLVENFRPGTMEKMGLGWEEIHEINPRLVMARISGFGQDGPLGDLPCFDGVAQAMGGLMDLTGAADGPPTVCGTYICDYTSGMYAAMGVLGALRVREQTGEGQLVDVTLLDSASSLLMSAIAEHDRLGNVMTRRGSRDRYATPNNVYQAADGAWVYLVCGGVQLFSRFAEAIGQPEILQDPRFATLAARREHWDETEDLARQFIGSRPADDAVAALQKCDVPCAKVATISDVVRNPQLRHRQQIIDVEHPGLGTVAMQGVTIKLSGTPLTVRRSIPRVGEHSEEVLREWLGDQQRTAA